MAIRMKTSVKLRVSAHCPSHSRADIKVRDVGLVIDEPEARGGTNMGPTPTDTAIAAFVGCVNVIGNKCAEKMGIDIGHLDIDAESEFDRRGVTLAEEIEVPFTSVTLTVHANGPASQEDLTRVGLETEKFCPLSKLFRAAGTKVEVNWQKA